MHSGRHDNANYSHSLTHLIDDGAPTSHRVSVMPQYRVLKNQRIKAPHVHSSSISQPFLPPSHPAACLPGMPAPAHSIISFGMLNHYTSLVPSPTINNCDPSKTKSISIAWSSIICRTYYQWALRPSAFIHRRKKKSYHSLLTHRYAQQQRYPVFTLSEKHQPSNSHTHDRIR